MNIMCQQNECQMRSTHRADQGKLKYMVDPKINIYIEDNKLTY